MLPILQHLPHFRLSPPFSPPAYVNAPRHSSSALCSLLFPSPVRPLWGGALVVRTPRPVCERKRKRKRMAPRWHGFPLYRTFSSFHAGRWAQTGRPIGKLSGGSTDWDSLAAENYGLIGANPPISPYWFRKSGAGRSGRITVDGHASATHLPDAISSTVFSSFAEFSLLPCAFFSRRSAHCPLSSTPVAFADIHAAGVSPAASTTETPRFLASLPYIYIHIYSLFILPCIFELHHLP